MNGIAQVQRGRERCDIGGIGVHLIAGVRLVGPAMSTAIVRYDPISLPKEIQHLVVPIVCTSGQRY